jgi:uncharacterized protein with NRDE domain
MNTLKEWNKFTAERDKMTTVANEVAAITRKVVQECLALLKTQNIDVTCDTPDAMTLMGQAVVVEPVIEAVFPAVKTKVNLTCAGATRSIIINPNLSISAGGNPFMFDQFKKGIPDSFTTNAAEFVSDAFLYIARTGGSKE